jgi:hypothetical protein
VKPTDTPADPLAAQLLTPLAQVRADLLAPAGLDDRLLQGALDLVLG